MTVFSAAWWQICINT